MVAGLASIRSFVQEYAETVAQVLELDVTIVDHEYIRLGGTGPYRAMAGRPVPYGSLFRRVLTTGRSGIIDDEERERTCQHCELAHECSELATMGFPVLKEGRPIGVIGVTAFTPEQKERMILSSPKLAIFFSHLGGFLEDKLLLIEAHDGLNARTGATEATSRDHSFGTIIGNTPAFRQLISRAERASRTASTVLIRGETGTGKELLARAIHDAGERSRHPFVVVNCPSIPESLLESELFGYEGGSFTGANKEGKPGKFELADHGTIFLDEIGDLSPALQPKLLRAIQERTVERLGAKKTVSVDVRVIAATNRDLEAMVREGTFRADLYYRLSVIPLQVPSLRERRDDIELYLRHFLEKYGQRFGRRIREVDPAVIRHLKNYDWPGNIRQLENTAEYLVAMAQTDRIALADLPRNLIASDTLPGAGHPGLSARLAAYEKGLLAGCLPRGSSLETKRQVAKELGISLATLYRKLEKYDLI